MKRADIILIVTLLVITCLVPFFIFGGKYGDGDTVTVYRDGEVYGVYSLYEDREVAVRGIRGYNILCIRSGQVYISDADCKGRDCIRSGAVSKAGEFIICVPHGLYIVISSRDGESPADGVTY